MANLVINHSTAKFLEHMLRGINVDDMDTIQRVFEHVKVANLQLSEGETLLVRVPCTSRISIPTTIRCVLIQVIDDGSDDVPEVASNEDRSVSQLVTSPVHPDYEVILRATTKGIFTKVDIDLNDTEVAHPSEVTQHVLKFETRLSPKRRPKNIQS